MIPQEPNNIPAKESLDYFLLVHGQKFPSDKLPEVEKCLRSLSENERESLFALKLKDPTLALLLSFFFGTFAIDRFYIGNIIIGILKLITVGGFGIWTIVDWFFISKITRQQNYELLMSLFKK